MSTDARVGFVVFALVGAMALAVGLGADAWSRRPAASVPQSVYRDADGEYRIGQHRQPDCYRVPALVC